MLLIVGQDSVALADFISFW